MAYGIGDTDAAQVDHEAMHGIMAQISGRKAALIGWTETTKHLINLMSDNVVAIYDEKPWTHGISFRGKTVSLPSERFDIDLIAVTDFAQGYDFAGRIRRLYGRQVSVYTPPTTVAWRSAHGTSTISSLNEAST